MAVPQESAGKVGARPPNCALATLIELLSNFQSRVNTVPGQPRFSTEIWRQIALWLPRHDLKTLLLVPHVLSRIASQLLFRKIDLHFGSDKWDSQRSADILTRIITDNAFANLVRTLRIFVPGRDVVPMSFQTGEARLWSNELRCINILFFILFRNACKRIAETHQPAKRTLLNAMERYVFIPQNP